MSQESQRRPDLGGPGAGSDMSDDTQITRERVLAEALAELGRLGLKTRPLADDSKVGRATCPVCQAEGALLIRVKDDGTYLGCWSNPYRCADDAVRDTLTQLRTEAAERERQAAERKAEQEREAAERRAATKRAQEAERVERERKAAEARAIQEARYAALPSALQELARRLRSVSVDEDGWISARCPLCPQRVNAYAEDGAVSAWCNGECDDDDVCRALQLPTVADRESMLDWDAEPAAPEWLIPDVVARGQFVSVFGRRGGGKSLLKLGWSVAMARAGERVLYLDAENPAAEVRLRLQAMGVTKRLEGLDYRSFPPIGALDTEAGAENFARAVRVAGATVVVLDTWSKFVAADELNPTTHTNAYKRAIVPLRADGVTVIVGDHPGKDEKSGPRGGSSKGDNVDVEWWFTSKPDGATVRVTLTNTKDRTGRCPAVIQLARKGSPLRHELLSGADAHAPKVAEILTWLEKLDVPPTWGARKASMALREAGYSFTATNLAEALRVRNAPE